MVKFSLTGLPRNKEELLGISKLKFLDSMQINTISKEIGQLTNLSGLYLAGNELLEIPKEIGQLTNLTDLILRDNHLSELPKEIANLINLNYLNLEENRFVI